MFDALPVRNELRDSTVHQIPFLCCFPSCSSCSSWFNLLLYPPSTKALVASCLISPAWVTQVLAISSSVQSRVRAPSLTLSSRKLYRFLAYSSLAWIGAV